MNSRRKFLASLGWLSTFPFFSSYGAYRPHAAERLRILVLGGTNFVGPAIVASLLENNHSVTLFNRGITNPELFPQLEKIRGDREAGKEGYKNLENKNWDIVIDVWPNKPSLVADAVSVLKDHTNRYIFISSIAAYSSFKKVGIMETDKTRTGTPDNYRDNKATCERIISAAFPEKFLILRAGAIVGERDPGTTFQYILGRIKTQPAIVAPDSNDPVQFIDVKDLAAFISTCIAKNHSGFFNLVGPREKLGYKDFILKIKSSVGRPVTIHWVDPDTLMSRFTLEPWTDLPFWIPVSTDPEPGFYQISNAKAVRHGLTFRKLDSTVKDALKFFDPAAFEYGKDGGISLTREKEIINGLK